MRFSFPVCFQLCDPQLVQIRRTRRSSVGGKPAAAMLLRPVKRFSKRGQRLGWLMEHAGSATVLDAAHKFGTTRGNVLSFLFVMNRDNGIGYTLYGDVITIKLPPDCEEVFT